MEMVGWWNLSRSLEQFMDQAMDWENYRDWVLDTMKKEKDKIFSTEWAVLSNNPRRAPLSVGTATARAKRTWYYKNAPNNPRILRWTSNLQTNISTTKDKLSCTMSFNADYAIYHQMGNGAKHRAVFEFNPAIKAEIMRSIQTQFNQYVWIWNARQAS